MAKILTILVVVAGVAWSVWWVVGSIAFERGARAAILSGEARGWDIAYDDLSVSGFPNRFDLTVDQPRVATPDGDVGWSAPFLQVFALSYRPNHLIAVAPNAMTVQTPGGEVAVTSSDLRASAMVTASTTPDLVRATVVADALDLTGPDWTASLAAGQVALREADGPLVQDLAIDLTDLRLPGVDPVESLSVIAEVTLDRPLASRDRARLDTLRLQSARALWSGAVIELNGDVTVGPDGAPRGDLTLRLTGWDLLLERARAARAIPEGLVPLLTSGLTSLSDAEGVASVPVSLSDGRLQVLGFPLAPLPRLPVPGR